MSTTSATASTSAANGIGDGEPQRAGGLVRAAVNGRRGAEVGPLTALAARRDALLARSWDTLDVRLLGTTIGGEVSGIDLAAPLADDVVAELSDALAAYKVLVFRDQQLDADAQLRFARRFGELEQHPFLGGDAATPELVRFAKDEQVAGYENAWHTDVTWKACPPMAAVLRAVEVPTVGGDTLWADMAAAYDTLDDDTKAAVEGRVAVHDFAMTFGAALSADDLAEARKTFPPVEHPVVRTHPVTGERVIFVNRVFTREVVGLEHEESEALLDTLFRQADRPEVQVRLRWTPGTVVVWDNRSTQHYAASDYWPQRRVMERAAIVGDRPT